MFPALFYHPTCILCPSRRHGCRCAYGPVPALFTLSASAAAQPSRGAGAGCGWHGCHGGHAGLTRGPARPGTSLQQGRCAGRVTRAPPRGAYEGVWAGCDVKQRREMRLGWRWRCVMVVGEGGRKISRRVSTWPRDRDHVTRSRRAATSWPGSPGPWPASPPSPGPRHPGQRS